jgi:hypothetical protein
MILCTPQRLNAVRYRKQGREMLSNTLLIIRTTYTTYGLVASLTCGHTHTHTHTHTRNDAYRVKKVALEPRARDLRCITTCEFVERPEKRTRLELEQQEKHLEVVC